MAKILKFHKRPEVDGKTSSLLKISDEIDALIAEAIFDDEINPRDVAGLIAHRLGALIRQLDGDDHEKLIAVCREVMIRQATKSSKVK